MIAFILIISCMLSAHHVKSFEWLDSNVSGYAYETKIKVSTNQKLADFLTEECKCPTEIDHDFFRKTYAHQWSILKSLSNDTKNIFLKKILDQTNDINYSQLRSGIACLIAAGASANQASELKDSNALYMATKYQDYEMVDFLLSENANPNKKLNTIVPIFYRSQSLRTTELFEQYNTHFSTKDSYDHTILHHIASQCGNNHDPLLIPFYIKKGVNVNDKDYYGNTAFHSLITHPDDKTLIKKATLLLEAGACVDLSNKNGQTVQDLLANTRNSDLIHIKELIAHHQTKKALKDNI